MRDMEIKRLEELAMRASRSGRTQFSRFLEPSMMDKARAAAANAHVRVDFYGGCSGAERCLAAFYDEIPPEPEDYPILALRMEWNGKYANPGHRDLLGAVMGMGIERDMTGDIAMGEYRDLDCAYLFALPEVADYIVASLESAGRAALRVCIAQETPELKPPQGERLRATVQNERLDAVLAAGYRLSRSEAQRLIAAGLVKLNHVPTLHGDTRLREGDLISAKGYGRLKLETLQGESRKGRQIIMLFRYGK